MKPYQVVIYHTTTSIFGLQNTWSKKSVGTCLSKQINYIYISNLYFISSKKIISLLQSKIQWIVNNIKKKFKSSPTCFIIYKAHIYNNMNQNPIPNKSNDVLKKRRGRPPKSDLLKNGLSTTQRTVVPIAPYPTPGNKIEESKSWM